MKKLNFSKIFIAVFLLICLIPSLGMTVAKSDTTSENRVLAQMPSFYTEDGSFNEQYFTQLGDYFNDHFAFRSYIVSLDSYIQAKLFGVSNVDTVIKGTDGWLYYMDTLDNYKGQNLLSERAINNIIHNIELMNEKVSSSGAKFLVTIAPNKNTLYPDNMPYYLKSKVSDERNAEKISAILTEKGINYVNLFELFSSQQETLYFKGDSHWNTMGAHLVYGSIMENLQLKADDYSDCEILTDEDFTGDLHKMVYPLSKKGESDRYYDYEKLYKVTSPDESPEAALIVAENSQKKHSLLMYRDSFGNSLYPIFANSFGKSVFSKATPYNLGLNMLSYSPDVVVVEKVERNIYDFAEYPPVFTSLQRKAPEKYATEECEISLTVQPDETNMMMASFTGEIPSEKLGNDGTVYLNIKQGNRAYCCEAFSFSKDGNDNLFKALIEKDRFENTETEVEVFVCSNGTFTKLATVKADISTIQEEN